MLKRMSFLFLILFNLGKSDVYAQHLDFIGLKGVSFGMNVAEMKEKRIILDSTSSYKDSATYIRNTRCHLYYKSNDNLQLNGFVASGIQYEFCDGELAYVFVTVKGSDNIDKATNELKKTFTKLGCKGKKLSECTQMDASAKGMRVIVNIDRKKDLMTFVLIPKKPQ